jgi:hypothetical protein
LSAAVAALLGGRPIGKIFVAAGSDEVGDVGINCERLGDVDSGAGFKSFALIPNSPAN